MNTTWNQPLRRHLAAVVLLSCLVLAACAVNPATGKRQLMLITESQEKQIGKENDPAVVAQFGLYDDPDLQAYVSGLGRGLAAKSERPDLDWTFRVVDDKLVNAFALPGGYIYITRGILAHFNSEAELVSVLGHEIGHVTARHGANQMSKAQLTQAGLLVGALAAPERMEQFGGLAQTAAGLLFLKFSRDDEKQADDLGLRYLVHNGYDPRPMADVFSMLKRVGDASGAGGAPSWLLTHPHPENRESRIEGQIAELGRDFSGAAVRQSVFLDKIGGLVYGDDPRQGYFKEEIFYHPEMTFRLDFPADWQTQNGRSQVVALHPEKDAMVVLTLASKETAAAARDEFLGQEGLTRGEVWSRSVNGLTAAGGRFSASVQGTVVEGEIACVEHDGKVFRLLGYATQSRWSSFGAGIHKSLTSFRRLNDRRMLDVAPRRVKVVRPDRSMDLEGFARRYDATVEVEDLAHLNGLAPGERIQAGKPYKVVQGGRLP